jgi:hypothetical protein
VLPGVAVRVVGASRSTRSVVEAAWLIVPEVPVTVSESA